MKKPKDMSDDQLAEVIGAIGDEPDDFQKDVLREFESRVQATPQQPAASNPTKHRWEDYFSYDTSSRNLKPMAPPTAIEDLTDEELLKFFANVDHIKSAMHGIQTQSPWYDYAAEAAKRLKERGPERSEFLEELLDLRWEHLQTADARAQEALNSKVLIQSAFDQYVQDTTYVLLFTLPVLAIETVTLIVLALRGLHG